MAQRSAPGQRREVQGEPGCANGDKLLAGAVTALDTALTRPLAASRVHSPLTVFRFYFRAPSYMVLRLRRGSPSSEKSVELYDTISSTSWV